MDKNIRDRGGNNAYSSCTQFVCAALSSIDYTAYKGSANPTTFINYCISQPKKYKYFGHIAFSELRDGDILCHEGHTAIYVKNIAQNYYPGTFGNIAEAGYTTHQYPGIDCWFTLGRHTLGELDPWEEYIVFRPI